MFRIVENSTCVLIQLFFFEATSIFSQQLICLIPFILVQVQEKRETLVTELNEILLEEANAIPRSVVDCIMETIQTIMEKGSIDCKLASQHIAFTFLGATLFGDAFLSSSKATNYEELLMMIAKDAGLWASYNVIPFWKRRFWKYRYLCTKLKCLTRNIVQQCRENYLLFFSKDHGHCKRETNAGKVDMMANKFIFQELRGRLNETEEPCSNIMGLMFHGCITTAALINNALLRLAIHLEIQDKVHLSFSPSGSQFDIMLFNNCFSVSIFFR